MTTTSGEPTSRSAAILYRPVGIVAGLLGGLIASQVFRQLWKRIDPDSADVPPKPLESSYGVRRILLAAAIEGALFTTIRALIQRGGARAFQRWTGEWPGN